LSKPKRRWKIYAERHHSSRPYGFTPPTSSQ
jgi:hypothetical protein